MLNKYRYLFEAIEKRNIWYVIWKSLEFWEEQLEGQGDVDVVFDPVQYDEVLAVMWDQHFAEDLGSPNRIGDRIKVFRGFDSAQLKHVTIHVHFDCWFGSKRYKEFVFPDTRELFDHRYRDQGVLRICQGHFIVTRVLMVALRRIYYDVYVCELAAQYETLDEQDRLIVDKHLTNYFNTPIGPLMNRLADGDFSCLDEVRESALRLMEQQQPFAQIGEEMARNNHPRSFISHTLARLIGGKRNKLACPMSIMLAGHDGSGKSTAAKMIRRYMAKIAMTKNVYLGRSTWAIPNRWLNTLRQWHGPFRALNVIWPFTSTLEIIIRFLIGKLLVKYGFIVIYDRSTIDLMIKWGGESRKIGSWFPLWVARKFGRKAEADLCYLLLANPDAVTQRKPEAGHKPDEIYRLTEFYCEHGGSRFEIVDTTEHTPEILTGRIIGDAFRLAAQAQAQAQAQAHAYAR